jgi:hypothetical protein
MKILTLNFLTCARKTCKPSPASFPLRPKDAELELVEADLNPTFLANMLPRLEWDALKTVWADLGLPSVAAEVPSRGELWATDGADTAADTVMDGDGGGRGGVGRGAGAGAGAGAVAVGEGFASLAAGDDDSGGQIGVWELWARVCGQGRDCQFLAAGTLGLKTMADDEEDSKGKVLRLNSMS